MVVGKLLRGVLGGGRGREGEVGVRVRKLVLMGVFLVIRYFVVGVGVFIWKGGFFVVGMGGVEEGWLGFFFWLGIEVNLRGIMFF